MSMQDLEQAFKFIENINEKDLCGPRSEDLVQKAEKALAIKFPPTYRVFVKQYGCGEVLANEIYGLFDDNFINSSACNAVWLTLDERKTGCPHSFIIIASTGFGPQYVLDSSQPDQDEEYPVLLWHCGDPLNTTEKVAKDFGEFLLQQVQQALAEDED